MNTAIWIALAVPMIVSVAPITQGRGHKIDEKQLARYVSKRGLPLPPALRQPVLDRIGRQERSALTWTLILFALGVGAALIVELATGFNGFSGLLVLLPPAFGAGLGTYLGVRRTRGHLVADAPRVARSQAIEVSDYTTRAEDLAVKLALVTVLVAAAAALVVWLLVPVKPSGGAWVPAILVGVTAILVGLWALARKAERDLIDRPQHAHTELELAWDDATRTDAIRALRDNSVMLSLISVLGLLVVAGTWVIEPQVRAAGMDLTLALGLVAFGVGVACWIALIVPWATGRSRRNPALGLWIGKFGVA
ncbi:hypothetical protein AADG42_12815 [Ammonicoccus fulvus]|uniref:Uncharacterized protein n=1 Tax=Ammonicoccus fulvus TaxID=3138240 RepID=A0ABZ3FPZ1_9ACTN